ncbi:PREDICTED: UPF0711 protein C18orf21 homolog [Gavialis gangeticus]|uniref:UPF0711 protein C18orf21 homolog n=1 Tax=Gavialis gangeticus TaxID=94835 RepID=UPI00092E50C3|nr:PREDICTED: UPF0711 protein C18orf21 homolog [Gavialis gangeticus]
MPGRRRFLEAAARGLSGTCPAQARFLLWTLQALGDDEGSSSERICPYCFQFRVPGNHRVRLEPKRKATRQVQKLLCQKAKNRKFTWKQMKLWRKYQGSKSILLVTCNLCNKTTRHYGERRDFLATVASRSGTPRNKSVMETPVVNKLPANKTTSSYSNSGSKGRSPASISKTCKSGKSTPSSSPRTPRNTKFHFSHLKWLLDQEEKEKSQKGGLKNFLSSL